MALDYAPNQKWPPGGDMWKPLFAELAMSDAWFSGDPQRLADAYEQQISNPFNPKSRYWAKQAKEDRVNVMHLPVTKDIAITAASLLFGEHPDVMIMGAGERTEAGQPVSAEADAAQERLDDIRDQGQWDARLIEAEKCASGMGGVFLKLNWDEELSPVPILQVQQPDNACPEFRFGMMVACTLWKVMEEVGSTVYRYLERHEPGVIYAGVYRGTSTELGTDVGLDYFPETKGLEPVAETGLDGLALVYIPNMLPNQKYRTHAIGQYVGQADTYGLETFMESLDEAWGSWMDDVRLGTRKLAVPDSMLKRDATDGFQFDLYKKIFIQLEGQGVSDKLGDQVQSIDFPIRAEEHYKTCNSLYRHITSSAGYSPQSFGLDIQGSAESGTALRVREERSLATTRIKAEYWQHRLEYLATAALTIDRLKLGGKSADLPVSVTINEAVQADRREKAETVEILNRAGAISAYLKVKEMRPDFTEDEVMAEVERIKDEQGMTLPEIGVA